jgi:hypothetical protein
MSMKNPLTAGIEPATFRLVTQHLSGQNSKANSNKYKGTNIAGS